jgi:xylan 1,4-beta-xylosidase
VSAQASLDDHKLAVLIWHYHDDDVPGPAAAVDLNLTGLPAAVTRAKLTQYRIDAEHSNSYTAWLRLGSPAHPTPAQYAELDKSGQLALLGTPENIRMDHGSTLIQLHLPRQAVSLLVLEW